MEKLLLELMAKRYVVYPSGDKFVLARCATFDDETSFDSLTEAMEAGAERIKVPAKLEQPNWHGVVMYKHRAFGPLRHEDLGNMRGEYKSVCDQFKSLAEAQLGAMFGKELEKDVERWEVRVRPAR